MTNPSVLLLSSDPQLTHAVEAACPAGIALSVASDPTSVRGGRWSQVWVDLSSTTPEELPPTDSITYFPTPPERTTELRSGLVLSYPEFLTTLQHRWPQPLNGKAEAVGALPGWTLELSCQSVSELSERCTKLLPGRLGAESVRLYTYEASTGAFDPAPTAPRDERVGAPIPFDPTRLTSSTLTADLTTAREQVRTARGPESSTNGTDTPLMLPLIAERVIGALELTTAPTKFALDSADFGLLLRAVATYLSRALTYDQAHAEARVDSLTGLANLRGLSESLAREIGRSQRFATPLSVIMLDVDGLKAINDAHGHNAGNSVLRTVSTQIATRLRGFDTAGRLGGDEFAVVLPGTTASNAGEVALRIHEAINRAPIGRQDRKGQEVNGQEQPTFASISAGVAQWQFEQTADDVLEAADHAMYQAKHSTTERVVIATPTPRGRAVTRLTAAKVIDSPKS